MATHNPKYVFIVGGVISGVGKGIAASSIARIMKNRGYRVTALKIDPYINIDAGTMNPTEHGEVFVLRDGDETDQDMGNYERFLNVDLTRSNYMTTGRVYQSVIQKERSLAYGGKCVEVVPHIPLEVIERIQHAGTEADAEIVLVEIGGTVGEYQNMLFLEALRMMKVKHPNDVFSGMVSYLPIPSKVGEMKTKPTQTAVRMLNASGIQPDFIIARSQSPIDLKRKEKMSLFCNVAVERIISAPDIESIYDVPHNFEKESLGELLVSLMRLKKKVPHKESAEWNTFVNSVHKSKKEVRIAIVGKYFDTGDFVLTDSYISVLEALKYSAYALGYKPVLSWISSQRFEKGDSLSLLDAYDGILVPGGFGSTGIEGKIRVIEYARTKGIPYFGLCYGMQLLVIEYARNVLGLKGAHTEEVDKKTKHPVVGILLEQKKHLATNLLGGSMRLGVFPCVLKKGSAVAKAYGTLEIEERHRHRFEVNNAYRASFEKAGLVFSGTSPDGALVEIAELPKHPFFVGVQFHPEFLARPLAPHPLFTAFIKASGSKTSKKYA
jgi:CTP synthase